eukprot:COSAG06_NODE_16994_length_968_cov_0.985040_2_plen_102_part_01
MWCGDVRDSRLCLGDNRLGRLDRQKVLAANSHQPIQLAPEQIMHHSADVLVLVNTFCQLVGLEPVELPLGAQLANTGNELVADVVLLAHGNVQKGAQNRGTH